MAAKYDIEELFIDFFYTANEVFQNLEAEFGIDGVWEKIFQVPSENKYGFSDEQTKKVAMQNLRNNFGWTQLEILFDYAVHGISDKHDENDIITAGLQVISYLTTENNFISGTWRNNIATLATARWKLDDGSLLSMNDVALLSDIDIRTVKNAVSKNEMESIKRDSEVLIENLSARIWLSKRKGFKPTITTQSASDDLNIVTTPSQFATVLKNQRHKIEENSDSVLQGQVELPFFVHDLEQGIFNFPISISFQIADFYHFKREEFLDCVMRVFYQEEYSLLISKNRQLTGV